MSGDAFCPICETKSLMSVPGSPSSPLCDRLRTGTDYIVVRAVFDPTVPQERSQFGGSSSGDSLLSPSRCSICQIAISHAVRMPQEVG